MEDETNDAIAIIQIKKYYYFTLRNIRAFENEASIYIYRYSVESANN